jgi:cytosine/adenosine deaminase-related metal-dependent hydrolase
VRRIFEADPALRQDPRFALYPEWMQQQVRNPQGGGAPGGGLDSPGNNQMLMDIFKAGGKVVAGTDTPNAVNLHGELNAYVSAGMTPFQALRAATATPAEALNLDAGIIAAGKLADIVLVEGNPLERIGDALKVRRVMANGRLYDAADLAKGTMR